MSAAAVLVLDAEWRPLRITSWQRVAKKIFTGRLEVIEYSRDHSIRMHESMSAMPSVVRILRHFKRDKIRIKFSRLNVYTRDRFTCQYCGKRRMAEDLNLDHVIPRAQGGKTTWENIVTACITCNTDKANRTPAEAGLKLIAKPRKPTWLPLVTVRMRDIDRIPEEWRAYWNVSLEP